MQLLSGCLVFLFAKRGNAILVTVLSKSYKLSSHGLSTSYYPPRNGGKEREGGDR